MYDAGKIKQLITNLGADLCGIAPAGRFNIAPEDYRPADLFPAAKSVIVFAIKIPESICFATSPLPYSFTDDIALGEISRLTFKIAVRLEKLGIIAVPVPSEPYEYWDQDSLTGKGLLSLKHAGYLAGLGVIGRNDLLCNPDYGNLIKIGALVCNAELEADPVLEYNLCSDHCNLCINNCPSGALKPGSVTQKNCRQNSEGKTRNGIPVTVCNRCRTICPNRAGWKQKD